MEERAPAVLPNFNHRLDYRSGLNLCGALHALHAERNTESLMEATGPRKGLQRRGRLLPSGKLAAN